MDNTKGKYQGQDVTVVRPARQGDKNFDASVEQVVIKSADGTEKTVAKSEVSISGSGSGASAGSKPA